MSSTPVIPVTHITDTNLEEFKKLVRKATFLTKEEDPVFKAIPNETWRAIFAKNFDGNFEYAKRVLLNQFKEIDKLDTFNVDREKGKIHNIDKAAQMFVNTLEKNQKVLFVTDFDNDGSLSQAIINEYLAIDKNAVPNCIVEYAQTMMGSARGINLPHIEHLAMKKGISHDEEFLIVTADNGINSKDEVKQIQAAFPKAKIIITDHHNPDDLMVVEENENCVIFNPHYKPTPFYQKYNISGATTVGVLMNKVLSIRFEPIELITYRNNLEKMNTLFKVSNLLDYVDTHAADKPEKDYIVSKFLELQPLLNINNSISKIIVGEITPEAIIALEKKIPNLDVPALSLEAENVHVKNHVAKVLLYIFKNFGQDPELTASQFQTFFLKELTDQKHILDETNANPNYIEQLRPLIFSLSADYDKNTFLNSLCDQMINVFESIRESEKKMGQLLRAGEVVTKQKLPNSTIAYADENILSIFNRKFLNKVYNDENPGFSLTLDSIKPGRVSGSFRSIYNISDILPPNEKAKLEKKLNLKIETPGHEKAAGFILISRNPEKYPVTEETIATINEFINGSIEKIKLNQKTAARPYLLTDFTSIGTIDKINKVTRGNISNFEYINSIVKLTPDTVWTDTYTTEQFTLKQIADTKKYGYITIKTDFHDGTIIVPVELVRKIVDNNYKDYLSLGYMDGGVFMVDKIVPAELATNIIPLTRPNEKEAQIKKAWEADFKTSNLVKLDRDQIKDNPFFKYHDYGRLNFDLFERIVIGIIDTNKVDTLSIFDVEANGFANSKIINFGATNYTINPNSGQNMDAAYFYDRFYHTDRGEEYLLDTDDIKNLKTIDEKDKKNLTLDERKLLLKKYTAKTALLADELEVLESEDDEADKEETGNFTYYLPPDTKEILATKQKKLPYTQIKNQTLTPDGKVVFNREIEASMLAYLIKDNDFKMPQEMINLTGITQELLDTYGMVTKDVDASIVEFFKGKKVLFGAHNTPYDARVLRANLPNTYDTLKANKIYDSAIFAKEQKLAYDDVKVAYFEGVDGIPENIYFYNNKYSDFSLEKFVASNKDGYFPDRTGQYLLEIDGNNYHLIDKVKHGKTKLKADLPKMQESLRVSNIPNQSIKYSVEKLSEQWMIHSLLLSDEKFNIKYVDLNKPEYNLLKKHKDGLEFFQDNYHFDSSEAKNLSNFHSYYKAIEGHDESVNQLAKLLTEFLELNKDIQQKFSDAWMYKKVLEIKDPTRAETTKDLIDLVHYQTNVPKDKISKIFDEASTFKEKHGINHVLYHEAHANGPWRDDSKGDVAFEDKLTLGLLSQREYNSYDHNIKNAVDYFNQVKLRAKISFDVADQLSGDLAQDSYSFKQGIQYARDDISPVITNIQAKEAALGDNTQKHLVKFKLDNDVLPIDTAVYALAKSHVVLTRKDIELHKKQLSFILLYLQIEKTLDSKAMDPTEKQYIKKILMANELQAIEFKAALSDKYDYIEFNKKDVQVKKIIEKAKEMLFFSKESKTAKPPKISDIDVAGLNVINAVISKLIKEIQTSGPLNDFQKKAITDVKTMMSDFLTSHQLTPLERAISGAKDASGFYNYEQVQEDNFLPKVDILRQDLGKRILCNNLNLRIINNFVKEQQDLVLNNPLGPAKVKTVKM